MIPTGAIYRGLEGRIYLAAYNYNRDVYERPHEKIADNSIFVSHLEYTFGGRDGSVNTYKLNKKIPCVKDFSNINQVIEYCEDENASELQDFSNINKLIEYRENESVIWDFKKKDGKIINIRTSYLPHEDSEKTHVNYNTSGQILNLPENEIREILFLNNADFRIFCGGKFSKKNDNKKIEIVNEIIPLTKARFIEPSRLVTPGKSEFVDICLFFANYDPTGQGCPTAIYPGKNPRFDGEYFNDYFFFPSGECRYPCYADRKHRNPFKTLFKLNPKQLEEELTGGMILNLETNEKLGKKVKILHFGKRVDPYGFYAEENLTQGLEVCARIGTKPIIITKLMPYKKEFLDLIKKSKGSLYYSISLRDDLEPGALANGASNERRIEQAEKYKENDLTVGYFLTIVGDTQQIPLEQINFVERAKEKKIQVTPHPFNFKRKAGALLTTGKTWENLLRSKNYYLANSSELVLRHQFINPEYYKMIQEGSGLVSMCHHDSELTFCSGCGMRGSIIKKTGEPTKLFHRRSNKFKDKNQIKIEF